MQKNKIYSFSKMFNLQKSMPILYLYSTEYFSWNIFVESKKCYLKEISGKYKSILALAFLLFVKEIQISKYLENFKCVLPPL